MNPEGRFYSALVISAAGGLFAMGIAVSVLTVASVLGPFRFLAPDDAGGVARIGLWLTPSAQTTGAEEILRRLRAWRGTVSHERDSVVAAEISTFREEGIDLLAVVDGRRLSQGEVAHLLGFVHGGGSVLLTGPLGIEDRHGKRRGNDVMMRLLGTESVSVLPAREGADLAPNRRGPLVAPLEPGQRLEVNALQGRFAVAGEGAELIWSGDVGAGASLRRQLGKGRVAWLAAGPADAIAAHSRELLSGGALTRVIEATLAWLAGEPRVEVLPWPGGAPFAVLRRLDGESQGLAGGRTPNRAPLHAAGRRAARSGAVLHMEDLLQDQPRADPVALAAEATRLLGQQGGWIASGGEYAQWRRARRELAVALRSAGPNRLVLDVTNEGGPFEGAVVRVHLNEPVLNAEVGRTVLQQGAPLARFESRTSSVDIALPPLRRRDTQSFVIDLERFEEA